MGVVTERRFVFHVYRRNNIDHVIPVIARLSDQPDVSIFVVTFFEDAQESDFRLRYLRSKPSIAVGAVDDFAVAASRHFGLKDRSAVTVVDLMRYFVPDGTSGVAVFDDTILPNYIDAARALGIKTVSLPHGDDPFTNFMITADDLTYYGLRHSQKALPYDLYVSSSRITARRESPAWEGKHRVLGSARFSPEWMAELDRLVPPASFEGSDGKLKLVFFLRNAKYAVFWEEFERLLKLILQFRDIDLVIVGHPRQYVKTGKDKETPVDIPLPSVERGDRIHPNSRVRVIAPDLFHGSQLIRWADAVLSLGTSVVYEAVLRGKPVFEIEYLHPNRTVVGALFKNADIVSRDQMYDWIERLLTDPAAAKDFYAPEEMAKFRQLCIDLGLPGSALDRYVALLVEAADARIAPAEAG